MINVTIHIEGLDPETKEFVFDSIETAQGFFGILLEVLKDPSWKFEFKATAKKIEDYEN